MHERIYYFVGDPTASTEYLVGVISDLLTQIAPSEAVASMLTTSDSTPLVEALDAELVVSRPVPDVILEAICAAVGRSWSGGSVTAHFSVRTEYAPVEPDENAPPLPPVRRLAELILTAPPTVDLNELPPLIETVLRIYGNETVVSATRGEVRVWDLGGGWKFVSDVRTPTRRYGVEHGQA